MALISMEGVATGNGKLEHSEISSNHNLSDNSLLVVRAMMIGVSAEEFFKNNKAELFAENLTIEDAPTGRKFIYSITAKEI
jgi:hypothetical protein